MGLSKLLARIRDATMAEAFEGLFPRDDPSNTRFSINFFTSIGKVHLIQGITFMPHFQPALGGIQKLC